MKIKQQDNALIIAGKYKGKQGKILKIFNKTNKVIVEKVNIKTKHIKPNGEGKKGTIKQIEAPIDISNIVLIK
uniref:Large ribosomal subunit protein uL24c n=1 Tax=Campylaephora sungminbooi TaxID=1896769 RepID=A0A1B0TI71_9FLOR|nr:50S ribosomal protein L24 [Campylaephora sungminbooi]AKU47413.1 50S ribosomal protein L24 [Campylaephora sungminbooi]ALN11860.1 50S ribosomal protein L24 [Campylaephora sungminbooi]